jgi:2-dehydropantoate 2-reductase
MLRDIERNATIEADHIIGDLLARRTPVLQQNRISLLEVAFVHLKAYEARQRSRGSTA